MHTPSRKRQSPETSRSQSSRRLTSLSWPLASADARTLVVYVFSDTDSGEKSCSCMRACEHASTEIGVLNVKGDVFCAEYAANLRFFISQGMSENDGCEYIIVVQHVRSFVTLSYGTSQGHMAHLWSHALQHNLLSVFQNVSRNAAEGHSDILLQANATCSPLKVFHTIPAHQPSLPKPHKMGAIS